MTDNTHSDLTDADKKEIEEMVDAYSDMITAVANSLDVDEDEERIAVQLFTPGKSHDIDNVTPDTDAPEPLIDPPMLRKYISYAQSYDPVKTDIAASLIDEYDAPNIVLDSMAQTIARMRLSDHVTAKDVDWALIVLDGE